ncbi:MAG: PDZ domain-containing protein [Acidobacteriia bacterium]|nr:PDZ domain-containing protein [Terriglobia bacterium]
MSKQNKNSVVIIILMFSLMIPSLKSEVNPQNQKIEEKIQDAIDAVYPALVQIYVLSLRHNRGRGRKFESAGSGVIIAPEGYVITNHHVAGKATSIRCVLSTREELRAELVGTDPLSDIAVLKLDMNSRPVGSSPLPLAYFGSSKSLSVGEPILAMGCPLAISQSVTRGIVSNKDMIIPKRMSAPLRLDGENVGSVVKWIGHDASIFPGNSGGPLVNLRGEIVGINEIGLGLSGAIPSELADSVSQELIQNGLVKRAWIGASFQPMLKSNDPENFKQGVVVSGVVPGSPSEQGGLKPGDVVLAIDEISVQVRFEEEMPALIGSLLSKPVGVPIRLKIKRGMFEKTLKVTPQIRDDARGRETEIREWGITVRRLTLMDSKEMHRKDQKGVLVGSVRPGGPGDKSVPNLLPGDVIVNVNKRPIDGIRSFRKLTDEVCKIKKTPVAVVVTFDRKSERFLTVAEIGLRKSLNPPVEATKAWLPIATQVLSRKLAKAMNLQGKKGVRITQVYPNSSAQQAGFQVGDILTHVDGLIIDASESQDSEVFETMIRAYRVDDLVNFNVVRNGQKVFVSAKLVKMPTSKEQLQVYQDLRLEFEARDVSYMDQITNQWKELESGAMITQVDSGGWAAVAGLRAGDLIKAVNHKVVDNVRDLQLKIEMAESKKNRNIVFFVKRGIHTLFVELEPNWKESNSESIRPGEK